MRFRFQLLLFAILWGMIACQQDQSSPATPTAEATDPSPPTAAAGRDSYTEEVSVPPVDGAVELRMFIGDVGNELALAQAAVARYEAQNPDVSVELIPLPNAVEDRRTLYQEQFANDSTVDIYQIDVIWPGELAEQFIDLKQYGADTVAGDHFPTSIANNTVDGRLVAMPLYIDAGLLYYRTDLLEKYGFDGPPTTWTEMEDMAATIQAGERAAGNEEFWGYLWQGAEYEGLTCNALEWMVTHQAGTLVDGTQIAIDEEATVRSLQQAKGWVNTISPPQTLTFREEDTRAIWEAGDAAFMRNWPYVYATSNESDSVIKGLFNVSSLPAVSSSARAGTLGGWQLAVSKASRYPAQAVDLILFMTSREEQKSRAVSGSFNPTRPNLYEDPDILSINPFFGDLYDVFVGAVPRPSSAVSSHYTEFSIVFHQSVHSVLMGEQPADMAVQQMSIELSQLLPSDK